MEETLEVSHHLLYPQASTIGYTLVIVKLILWIQCSTKGCDTNQTLEVDTQALSGDRMWSRDWELIGASQEIHICQVSTWPCCTLEKQDWLPGAFERNRASTWHLLNCCLCFFDRQKVEFGYDSPTLAVSFCHLWGPWP